MFETTELFKNNKLFKISKQKYLTIDPLIIR